MVLLTELSNLSLKFLAYRLLSIPSEPVQEKLGDMAKALHSTGCCICRIGATAYDLVKAAS